MINYDQHMQFLDREVQRTWDAFRETQAERQGFQDAYDFGKPVRDYSTPRQQHRYALGVEIGLMKLLLEQLEVNRETKSQSGGHCTNTVGAEMATRGGAVAG